MSNSAFTPTFAQNLQDASATQKGLVNTTTQTFAGDKTFTGKVISDTLQAATSGGLSFKENDGTTTGTVSDAGAWVLGPSTGANHTVNGKLAIGTNASGNAGAITITAGVTSGSAPIMEFNYADAASNLKRSRLFADNSGNLNISMLTDAGAESAAAALISRAGSWTLGPSGNTTATHVINGGTLLFGTATKLGGGISGFDINSTANAFGTTFGVSGTAKAYQIVNVSAARYQGETASGYTITFVSGGSGGVSLANSATSWAALSDVRQKKNITDINYGLNEITALRPVRFDYLSDEADSAARIGFIAQEVRDILPEAVSGSEEKEFYLSQTEMIPVLVKAIQELKQELDTTKAELAELKNK